MPRIAAVVKPGRLVALLEDDTLQQVLLAWPFDLETVVRLAEWGSLRGEADHPSRFEVGRRLAGVFREAGLEKLSVRSFASTRLAPLDPPVRAFLVEDLHNLTDRITASLKFGVLVRFPELTIPARRTS